ncbi:MAG: radical SAM protein [Candidatus Thermoplasmatota archaeon]|nr:radical SAM protein [Candidatus Thermoplasmatota archaeon]
MQWKYPNTDCAEQDFNIVPFSPSKVIVLVVKEIEAKSILRKHKKIDSWFLSAYGMNLYRGCTHNCVYCDGRAEGYFVEGEFGRDVSVKVNALEVLCHELDPHRKRTPFKSGYIMVGGGVGDSYQPLEEDYQLTRKTLQLLCEKKLPVHILTKSTLVKRDVDLLRRINEQSKAIVSFSFSSTNETISKVFEPGVSSPQKRLETISYFKENGIACGMFLLPVIPFITDTKELMEKTIQDAQEAGVDFIIFGGMTLKQGKQTEYFLNVLRQYDPTLEISYQRLYPGDTWGQARPEYYDSLHQIFCALMRRYRIPIRIPPRLFHGLLSKNDLVVVILEHLDYFLKLEGKKSPFGYAAYSISKLKKPLSTMLDELSTIKGVGTTTEHLIREILRTGHSSLYEQFLHE